MEKEKMVDLNLRMALERQCLCSLQGKGKQILWKANFIFLNELITLWHVFQHAENVSIILVHNFIIIGTTFSSFVDASDRNYSLFRCSSNVKERAAFIFVGYGLVGYFRVWLGHCLLGSNLINGGCNKNVLVCIFCKINCRRDVYSGLESMQ